MSFFLILFSQCSITDPEKIFLDFFQGTWKISPIAGPWFLSLTPSVTVTEGTIVNVATDGSFTITGTPPGSTVPTTIQFTFVEIEAEGILAVYELLYDSKRLFTGIGFGKKDDILLSPIAISSDLVTPPDKGDIFLIK